MNTLPRKLKTIKKADALVYYYAYQVALMIQFFFPKNNLDILFASKFSSLI